MRRLLILALLLCALPVAAQTYRAAVVTPWVGSGTHADPYRPKLPGGYVLLSWDDVTGQPANRITPDPNAYTLEIQATGKVVDAIEGDAAYVVLWTEAVEEPDKPVQAALPWTAPWVLERLGDLLGPRAAYAQEKKPNEKVKPARPKKDQPPTAEKVQLRNGLKALGYPTATANALVRNGVARSVIQGDVVAAQKTAPKAGP